MGHPEAHADPKPHHPWALATLCALVATVSVAHLELDRGSGCDRARCRPSMNTGVTYDSFAEAAAFWDLHAAEALAARKTGGCTCACRR